MINREDPNYQEAKWRVKIGHAFLEKGYDIKGVVHVGANDGYEVPYYLQLGIEKVIAIEPYSLAIKLFKEKVAEGLSQGKVQLFECGLGSVNAVMPLRIAPDSGQGSSVLRVAEHYKDMSPFKDTENETEYGLGTEEITIKTWPTLLSEHPEINPDEYDCLVVDVQGMELDVLQGMGDLLKKFKFLNVECSQTPVYIGEAPGEEVANYLHTMGFHQDTPMEVHNDVFFIRKDVWV